MKKLFFTAILVTSLFSCKEEKKENSQPIITVVKNETEKIVVEKALLKNIIIDSSYFLKNTKSAQAISKSEVAQLQIQKQIPGFDDYRNTVKIFETLLNTTNSKVLLVACDEENESFVWLVLYNEKQKRIDSKLVFYQDFVEYFSSTSSVIKDNEITITTKNNNGEEQSTLIEKYVFDKNKLSKKN